MVRLGWRQGLAVASAFAALACIAADAGVAHATFPGANGKVVSAGFGSGVLISEPDGSHGIRLPSPGSASGALAASSPSGDRVVVMERDGVAAYASAFNGTSRTDFSLPYPTFITGPSFFPNGQRLVYPSSSGMVTMNADGTNAALLPIRGFDIDVTPDGQTLVYWDNKGDGNGADIFRANADGSNPFNLTNTPGHDSAPTVSPDGQFIYYARTDDSTTPATTSIRRMSITGAGGVALTSGTDYVSRPQVSPDGTRILFTRLIQNDSSSSGLWTVNADGSAPSQVSTIGLGLSSVDDWAPRGDATPPETFFTATPPDGVVGYEEPFNYGFDASEADSVFQCGSQPGASGEPFDPSTACASPFRCADSNICRNPFEVRAIDRSGNFDPTPATHSVTFRTPPPVPRVVITKLPRAVVKLRGPKKGVKVTFEFASSAPNAEFTCVLDGEKKACDSPVTYKGVTKGAHSFYVVASTSAGAMSSVSGPSSWRFKVVRAKR